MGRIKSTPQRRTPSPGIYPTAPASPSLEMNLFEQPSVPTEKSLYRKEAERVENSKKLLEEIEAIETFGLGGREDEVFKIFASEQLAFDKAKKDGWYTSEIAELERQNRLEWNQELQNKFGFLPSATFQAQYRKKLLEEMATETFGRDGREVEVFKIFASEQLAFDKAKKDGSYTLEMAELERKNRLEWNQELQKHFGYMPSATFQFQHRKELVKEVEAEDAMRRIELEAETWENLQKFERFLARESRLGRWSPDLEAYWRKLMGEWVHRLRNKYGVQPSTQRMSNPHEEA